MEITRPYVIRVLNNTFLFRAFEILLTKYKNITVRYTRPTHNIIYLIFTKSLQMTVIKKKQVFGKYSSVTETGLLNFFKLNLVHFGLHFCRVAVA